MVLKIVNELGVFAIPIGEYAFELEDRCVEFFGVMVLKDIADLCKNCFAQGNVSPDQSRVPFGTLI